MPKIIYTHKKAMQIKQIRAPGVIRIAVMVEIANVFYFAKDIF